MALSIQEAAQVAAQVQRIGEFFAQMGDVLNAAMSVEQMLSEKKQLLVQIDQREKEINALSEASRKEIADIQAKGQAYIAETQTNAAAIVAKATEEGKAILAKAKAKEAKIDEEVKVGTAKVDAATKSLKDIGTQIDVLKAEKARVETLIAELKSKIGV